jgi:hypothetical protein
MKRDVLGGGQPAGLAAAPAWGRRPPKAGGGPTKYHQLAYRIGISMEVMVYRLLGMGTYM